MMSQAILRLHCARVGLRLHNTASLPLPTTTTLRPVLSSARCIKTRATQAIGQGGDLPFPNLPSVEEDQKREEEGEIPIPPPPPVTRPEPENPLPEDLPENHPKESPEKENPPEIDPQPKRESEPLRSPPEVPIPSVPQEAPQYIPQEFPGGGSTPQEFDVPHPQEWTPP